MKSSIGKIFIFELLRITHKITHWRRKKNKKKNFPSSFRQHVKLNLSSSSSTFCSFFPFSAFFLVNGSNHEQHSSRENEKVFTEKNFKVVECECRVIKLNLLYWYLASNYFLLSQQHQYDFLKPISNSFIYNWVKKKSIRK